MSKVCWCWNRSILSESLHFPWGLPHDLQLHTNSQNGKKLYEITLNKILSLKAKPFRKVESVNIAFLFWYWRRLKNYFFRNKTFLFFKIESWNFQKLFEVEFHETSQNFRSFRQLLFSFFLLVVWLSQKFSRFHEILFQTDSESFSFLSWKTKKFDSQKNIS